MKKVYGPDGLKTIQTALNGPDGFKTVRMALKRFGSCKSVCNMYAVIWLKFLLKNICLYKTSTKPKHTATKSFTYD